MAKKYLITIDGIKLICDLKYNAGHRKGIRKTIVIYRRIIGSLIITIIVLMVLILFSFKEILK